MPRDGSGVYTKPSGSTAVSGQVISSSGFNTLIDDMVTDANAVRPVTSGGTGVSSIDALKTALDLPWVDTPLSEGAIGDGSADDTTILQAFVTAGAGTSIIFDPGKNYKITTAISVSAGTTIDMNGSTVTLDTGADRAFLLAGANITIKNGKCDVAFLGAGITTQFDGCVVENVEILNAKSTAISFLNCSNSVARGNHVWWDSTGVSARVSAGTALYGITTLVTTDTYSSQDVIFEYNKVDFTNFTAAQMESVDACILMRGDSVNGTYTNAKRFTARANTLLMPVGSRGVTYGSSLARPTGIEFRDVTEGFCIENICDGGDLTNSFGRVSRGSISRNISTNQTHYCAEVAQDCREIIVCENQFSSNIALQVVSITDCAGFDLCNNMLQGGDDSTSDCLRIQGDDTVGVVSGGRIVANAAGSDGIDIVGGATSRISGVSFFASVTGAGGHIHASAGTIPNLSVINCEFEGVAVRPLKITGTVSHLRVGLCDGIGTPLGSDLVTGTITASTYTDNNNLTGL